MANLQEKPVWETGIYQLETTDPVLGGPDGVDNLQAKQLANRTTFLKKQIDDVVAGALTAGYADRLKTPRNLAMTGDGSWNVSFDASGDVSAQMTLKDSGVAAGSYGQVTVDSKGRVTAARAIQPSDVPALDWSKITSGKPTTLSGYGIADAVPSAQGMMLRGTIDQTQLDAASDSGFREVNRSGFTSTLISMNAGGSVGPFQLEAFYAGNLRWRNQTDSRSWTDWKNIWHSGNFNPDGKADKATTLAGYGISDAVSKSDLNVISNSINVGKADKATTLAGYGIIDGASKIDLKTAIDGVIAGAPGALNTLQELASALGNDANYAASITKQLSGKADKATTLSGYGITDAAPIAQSMVRRADFDESQIDVATQPGFRSVLHPGYTSLLMTMDAGSSVGPFQLEAFYAGNLRWRNQTDSRSWTDWKNIWHSGNFSPDGKADKATTLAGYGISDAVSKSDLKAATDNVGSGKADKATTLAGYGITDAASKSDLTAAVDGSLSPRNNVLTASQTTRIIKTTPNTYDAGIYTNGTLELKSTGDDFPSLGLHRPGKTAVALVHKAYGDDSLVLKESNNNEYRVWHSGNDGAFIKKRHFRIHADDKTSLDNSVIAGEMGFNYGTSSGVNGPFIAFGGLETNSNYSCQLNADYISGNVMRFRTKNDDGASPRWNPWHTLVHEDSLALTAKADRATTLAGYGITDAAPNAQSMVMREDVDQSQIDTATMPGFRNVVHPGDTSLLMTMNAGGSVGPFQMEAFYGGNLRWRNQTDSKTWTDWKRVWHSGNMTFEF